MKLDFSSGCLYNKKTHNMNKRKIMFFIVLFVLIITTLFNYYINYTTNLVVNINDYKCEFVNITTIDDKKCNILIKTITNEYYSLEISNKTYYNLYNDENYHKCRIIDRYRNDVLYDTTIILIF